MPVYALDDQIPDIHPEAYLHPDAVVIGSVTVADGASVWPTAVLRADFGRIQIGARTSVQDGTVLHTTEQWPTVIGSDCVVGHNAHLEGCTVEDRCLIGSGSVVLNRAVVRRGSVVGAGAVVPAGVAVPAVHLAVGVPVKLRRLEETRQAAWIDVGVGEYLANAGRYRSGLRRIG